MTNPNEPQPTYKKWLQFEAAQSASEVARDALSNRLEQIPALLELVTHHGSEDPDHVRRLRVATRRASTALNLFRDFASPATFEQVARDLKKIRKAAGRVRDLDVLIENVRRRDPESDNLPALETRRAVAEAKIAKSYQKYIASGRLDAGVEQLLASIDERANDGSAAPFVEWSSSTLAVTGESFFEFWPDSEGSEEDQFLALHNFRLQVKKLRYQTELLGSHLRKKRRRKFNRTLKSLQSDLGEINDHDVAIQKTHRWMRGADEKKQERLQRQLQNELVARGEAVKGFQLRWPAESRDKLQLKFEKMLVVTPTSKD